MLLNSPNLSLKALHAVLGFLYTERLDADMADMDAVQQVTCCLMHYSYED